MKLDILDRAIEDILSYDKKTQDKIYDKLEYLRDNYLELCKTKNIEKLTNSSLSKYRLSKDIRAIFFIYDEEKDTINILRIANRENCYKKVSLKSDENYKENIISKKEKDIKSSTRKNR